MLIHLSLLTYSTHAISQHTHTSFIRILQTPHEDLVLFTSNHTQPSHRANSPSYSEKGLGGKRKGPPRALNLAKSNVQGSLISLPIYRTFASSAVPAATGPPLEVRPNRHMMMALAAPEEVHYHTPDPAYASEEAMDDSTPSEYTPTPAPIPFVHQPTQLSHVSLGREAEARPSDSSWQAPETWAVGGGGHPRDSLTTITTTTSITDAASYPHSIGHHDRPASKQLPPLPNLQLAQRVRRPAQATIAFRVTGTGGVVERPDPRDRRPPGIGEVAADGGFWVTKATRSKDLERDVDVEAQTEGQKMRWI